jgi:hypothetical protein
MAGKLTNWQKKITNIRNTLKIYQNWDFWFENIPSGNPSPKTHFLLHCIYVLVTGWPVWATFLTLGQCFLWPVFLINQVYLTFGATFCGFVVKH